MTFVPDSSPGRITPGKPLEPAGTTPQPQRDFQQYMQESPGGKMGQGPSGVSGQTPMNLAQGQALPGSPPTMDSIAAQARVAQDGLGQIGKQLRTPNLAFKRSQAHLLKNKLTGAHDYIRQAGEKVGIEASPFATPSGAGPLERFIAYVNDGQDQLLQVQQKLKAMSAKGQQLNAAEMLSVTVKMNLAQQEIEYSSTLLGKVIDSVKQIMNTQL